MDINNNNLEIIHKIIDNKLYIYNTRLISLVLEQSIDDMPLKEINNILIRKYNAKYDKNGLYFTNIDDAINANDWYWSRLLMDELSDKI